MKVDKLELGELSANCYIIYNDGDKRGILVDCGAEPLKIEKRLIDIGIEEITAVLLTHAHFDHIGAVCYFQKKGAKVYLHNADVGYDNSFTYSVWGIEKQDDITVDVVLNGGELLNINDLEIEVIHTPGHSKGGVCYRIGNAIFCGDTLFFESYGRTDLTGGSYTELRSSIKRLFDLEGNFKLYCGHGIDTDLDHERKFNPISADNGYYEF